MSSQDFLLKEQDEYPHPLEEAKNFNESVYWNCFDPKQRMGGWFRLGNRANEGYAELSVCLYLPDGRLAFMYGRPEISNNDRFLAGGLEYEVVEPFARIRTRYQGPVVVMGNPGELLDPSRAFRENPRQHCEIEWELEGISPLHGGEPTSDAVQPLYGRQFSRGHFNQHTAVRGPLRIGEEEWQLEGFGWRDHSWGPRYWQNIGYHRLLVGSFGNDTGFMFLKITDLDGTTRRHGVLFRDGNYEEIRDLDLMTEWNEDHHQRAVEIAVRAEGRTERIRGEVVSLAPLRNRREEDGVELCTQITEAMTEWTWNGKRGLGFSEYLDLVRDGETLGYPS
jgi:hypothetical protein